MVKKTHKAAPWMCGQCKSGFENEKAVRMHITDAHPTIKGCGIFRCISKVDGPEYEPSFADRSIEAKIAIDSGLQTEDAWLLG